MELFCLILLTIMSNSFHSTFKTCIQAGDETVSQTEYSQSVDLLVEHLVDIEE